MEGHVERVLTVLLAKVTDGVPDGAGGYLEPPVESVARRFLEDADGDEDEAAELAAREVLARRRVWSEHVWRGALMIVVGQVPLVGSATGVFYNQFESIWRQLRFLAIAAAIYGHDPRDDATQCQLILCLLDDKVRKGPDGKGPVLPFGVKSGVQVAATIITRHVVTVGGARFIMRRVLGGLLAGVVPEAVGILYTISTGNGGEVAAEEQAQKLLSRSKAHFKKEEQPTLTRAAIAFGLWGIPVAGFAGAKLVHLYDTAFVRVQYLFAAQLAHLALPMPGVLDPAFVPEFFFETVAPLVTLALKVSVALAIVFSLTRVAVPLAKAQTSLVAGGGLVVRAFLKLLSARNTANSAIMAIETDENIDALYHAHQAAVGFFLIAAHLDPKLKIAVPYVIASLLLWMGYILSLFVMAYASRIGPLLWEDILSASAWGAAGDEVWRIHAELRDSGFTWARLRDALNTLSTISLHVLLEEIRRPDLVITLFGPRKVVGVLLFAAKSLGNVVTSPDMILSWLDRANPPQLLSWLIVAMQTSATPLGIFWGVALHFELLSPRELVFFSVAVLVCIRFFLADRSLPPPFDQSTWTVALQSRHRLLYLLPELDDSFRGRIYFAIDFFESYESAISSSQDFASSRFVKVRDWVAKSFSKAEKRELAALGQNVEPIPFDAGIYNHKNPGQSWWAAFRGWMFNSKAPPPDAGQSQPSRITDLDDSDLDSEGDDDEIDHATNANSLTVGSVAATEDRRWFARWRRPLPQAKELVEPIAAESEIRSETSSLLKDPELDESMSKAHAEPSEDPAEGPPSPMSSGENDEVGDGEVSDAGSSETADDEGNPANWGDNVKGMEVAREGPEDSTAVPPSKDGEKERTHDGDAQKPGWFSWRRPKRGSNADVAAVDAVRDASVANYKVAATADIGTEAHEDRTSTASPVEPPTHNVCEDNDAARSDAILATPSGNACHGQASPQIEDDAAASGDVGSTTENQSATPAASSAAPDAAEIADTREAAHDAPPPEDTVQDNRWFARWRRPIDGAEPAQTTAEELELAREDPVAASDSAAVDNRWFARWRNPVDESAQASSAGTVPAHLAISENDGDSNNATKQASQLAPSDDPGTAAKSDANSPCANALQDNRWLAGWRAPLNQVPPAENAPSEAEAKISSGTALEDKRWFAGWRGPPQGQKGSAESDGTESIKAEKAGSEDNRWFARFRAPLDGVPEAGSPSQRSDAPGQDDGAAAPGLAEDSNIDNRWFARWRSVPTTQDRSAAPKSLLDNKLPESASTQPGSDAGGEGNVSSEPVIGTETTSVVENAIAGGVDAATEDRACNTVE